MKVLASWLRDFVEIPMPLEAMAARLSLAGVAVDQIEGDVLDLDVTSNRPDQLNHYGVAREVAALLESKLRPLAPAAIAGGDGPVQVSIEVSIEDEAGCGRYCALVFDDVRVGTSGATVVERLQGLGQRPINDIADWTNYTLWEMGHPTHAFDADQLRGSRIVVRRARAGETLVTLDGVERRLSGEDLVIADAERPVALAGVMGGKATAISAATRRVVLEAAWFDPLTVRRMARRHSLHTDASHRFERGADPEGAPWAARLIAARMEKTPTGGLIDVRGKMPERARIGLRAAAIERILGTGVEAGECERILTALGCEPEGEAWIAPSWRPDLTREIDLIEEIARLHGYDRFPARLPGFEGAAAPLPEAGLRDRVREQLRGRGFYEAVTVSFANESECRAFAPGAEAVRVTNPLNEEAAILRTSSLPAMVQLLRHNLHHGVTAPKLYEIGKIYDVVAGQPRERHVLTVGAVDAGMDYRGFKGEIEAVVAVFEGSQLSEVATLLQPEANMWLAEVALDRLYAAGPRQVRYAPPPRFPVAERDFSFLFADAVTWTQLSKVLKKPAIEHLSGFEPIEIYRGKGVEAGHFSLLLRARMQSPERTLLDAEIQAAADEIARRLRDLGGVQR